MLYALKSPDGHLVEEVVAVTQREVWPLAFSYIGHIHKEWHEKYYYRWKTSRRSARRMGWTIVKVELSELL